MICSLVLAAAMSAWSEPVEVKGMIDGKPGQGRLFIYTPAAYVKGQRLPLVLALHGWGHSPELWKAKGDLASYAEKHALVIAMPDMGKTVYETALYPESRGAWTVAPGARWAAEVILPYVRAHYAVWPDRAHTAVLGYSTGGRGAVLLAEAYPEFAFAGSLSGTYDLMTLRPEEGEYKIHAAVYGPREKFNARWERDNIVSAQRLAKLPGTRLFIAHGRKDRGVNPNQLEALRAALKPTAVAVEFVVVPEAGHDWAFWNSQWERLFELAAQSLNSPQTPPAGTSPSR
jgi:enterochelin esterase-like enzyme